MYCYKNDFSQISRDKSYIKSNLTTIKSVIPVTNTRNWARFLGDGNKYQYRAPYMPYHTILRNSCKNISGEVFIPNINASIAASYLITTKNKKIKNNTPFTPYNYMTKVFLGDNDNVFFLKNNYNSSVAITSGTSSGDGTSIGRQDYLQKYLKSNNSVANYFPTSLGYLHTVMKSNDGGFLLFHSVDNGSMIAGIKTTMTITKMDKGTFTFTNLFSAEMMVGISNTAFSHLFGIEPAFTKDSSAMYYPQVTASTKNGYNRLSIKKVSMNLTSCVFVDVPQTINLNGLDSYIYCVAGNFYYNVNASYYNNSVIVSTACHCIEAGGYKYLVLVGLYNQAAVNVVGSTLSNFTSGNFQYMKTYLFKIDEEVLDLVDVKQYGTFADAPQGALPFNDMKNLLLIRYGGLDILSVDTVNHKLKCDSINEPIYAVGIDDLERVWYTTSSDSLVADARLKVFSVPNQYVISNLFRDVELNYTGTDIDSFIDVFVKDSNGNYVSSTVRLLLEGPVKFTDNGSKTIDITTSATGSTEVPIKIFGYGDVKLYSTSNKL